MSLLGGYKKNLITEKNLIDTFKFVSDKSEYFYLNNALSNVKISSLGKS
jgi:hypothetical protein